MSIRSDVRSIPSTSRFGLVGLALLAGGLLCPRKALSAPMPQLPDLDVTCIERTPRYTPGPWVYPESGPQYLGTKDYRFTKADLTTGKHKQWPSVGEKVTFTAHVINKSNTKSPASTFSWYIDGKKVGSGKLPAMEPWGEVMRTMAWKWRKEPHTVRFAVDGKNAVKEICEKNNSVEDRTDAFALVMRVTPQLYAAWRTQPNGMGSYSFEDWVQRHMRLLNGALEGSAYPKSAPKGALDRARVDQFTVVSKEEMLAAPPQKLGFDGGWNYYDDAFGQANSWFAYHTQDDFIDRVDTGLIHELAHQLGAIDMYAIATGGCWNHARDEDGDILAVGYQTKQPDMMGGGGPAVDFDGKVLPALNFIGDADGRVTVSPTGKFAAFSEETVAGLNSLHGLRRGHFGLYLFDLPRQSFLKILDNEGKPVEGAVVSVYQQTPKPGPQSIGEIPVHSGKTDKDGLFALGSAPFGDVNCLGLNGALYITIGARGHSEYRFLDICNFNIAKWRGAKDTFTATFKTAVPPIGAPDSPRGLRWGRLGQGVNPVMRWEPSKSADVKSYNIYGPGSSDAVPSFDPLYVKIGTVPAGTTSYEVKPPTSSDSPWYTVTAVDGQGHESGYARNKELTRWGPEANAGVDREDAQSVKVTLTTGVSYVLMRNMFTVGPKTNLRFRVRSDSARSVSLRLKVEGLGEVDLPFSSLVPGTDLADGQWHDVSIDLRKVIDDVAAAKNVTPASSQTTWTNEWVVSKCLFGDWEGATMEESIFFFDGLGTGNY